uniref:26s protease regulatory n=2 Tax=Tetraselmis sp. GSL018 TaxID=582737 RepID=A0A061SM40_9CHLO|mmetsp:Transcript_739/g.1753  ORF Transcript_739/g.1753 Transcript_739/m.1753 type:complete len:632 (+) Transcript_739:132-2027(+)|eukprot:CAMPEP_0177582080 /NCGR_PEP_ID=MMETSP0419_2-20121207/2522_1 /TAXON_ID=582737 /ORGANISM="Tetraselmis sp., Strain GSL018" /LENGTH=631 /DNA_ID=CAMNT_0019071229 /DNA_START=56 /DNA_END=1951 /DNA_ORIENTATION=-
METLLRLKRFPTCFSHLIPRHFASADSFFSRLYWAKATSGISYYSSLLPVLASVSLGPADVLRALFALETTAISTSRFWSAFNSRTANEERRKTNQSFHSGHFPFSSILSASAAATTTYITAVLCETSTDPEKSEPLGEKDLQEAASHVLDAWREVKQELFPGDVPLELGQRSPSLDGPKVRLLGDQLAVQVAMRPGADLTTVLLECAAALSPGQHARGGALAGSLRVRVRDSAVTRVLHLEPDPGQDGGFEDGGHQRPHLQIFIPLYAGSVDRESAPTIEYFKRGRLDSEDIRSIRGILRAATALPRGELLRRGPESSAPGRSKRAGRRPLTEEDLHASPPDSGLQGRSEAAGAVQKLQSMGAKVFPAQEVGSFSWDELAGYEAQKSTIEETLLLALQRPDVYERIARKTRAKFASNRPRAVLFEGPPGTGKTTSARIIASQASVPLVYVPLEAILSKYYGESERLLAEVFEASETLGGCIIFLDEVDSLATTRGADMHEATRRTLGVLLRQLDGFDASRRSVVIAATNRKADLDPALLSRFDASVFFGLPDAGARAQILGLYAKHLPEESLKQLAALTKGMSGRDLRDICEQAERRWASKVIRGDVQQEALPSLSEYSEMCGRRHRESA